MRQKLKMPLVAACLCLAGAGTATAQWVVSDPTNLAQSIINSAKEMVETAGTKANTLNGVLETKKVFEQGKKYYDALKSVHDVVKGGVKVSKSIGLVMEISEIYVDNSYLIILGTDSEEIYPAGDAIYRTEYEYAVESVCDT